MKVYNALMYAAITIITATSFGIAAMNVINYRELR